ncbi:MAG: tyrosine-type recombinase/integrase [Deltaproteobacteria bacterium]|nr:tyrosine-type recombinase/integrase [Deltaproteobacteria bacterium]
MDLHTQITLFLDYCHRQGLSPHTKRAYQGDLAEFLRWSGRKKTKALGRSSLESWLSEMRRRNYAPATIKRKLATLRAALGWLKRMRYLTDNPFQDFNPTIKFPQKLPRALSRTELRALFRQAEEDAANFPNLARQTMRLALELLFATGLRVGELCAVRLQSIDLDGGVIRVNGKGSRERQVYVVDQDTIALLRQYLRDHAANSQGTDCLLLTNRGTAATPDFIRRSLHELARRARLDRRVTPHMLRHSAATQLLEQGVDIRYVQRLLGHSSISTTEIYTHVSNASLKASLMRADHRRHLDA